ncbi:MAG: glycosyltransferase family 2 protein [Planctomycetales bacterium]|nr:glycosyltransferase family 2 protein [Planctomycetales bacterium]
MLHDSVQWILLLCVAALALAYVVFPVLMVVLGVWDEKRRPAADSEAVSMPTTSLIIPAYNEQAVIESKLENSLALEYPEGQLEIVVACDGVSDNTAKLAQRYASDRVKVFDFPIRRGKAAVINDAIERSTGDVICLCDANVMFATDALKRLVARLSEPGVGAVSGDVRLDSARSSFGVAERIYYWMERGIHRGESATSSMIGVDGGMYVIRRVLYFPIRNDTILDDFTISMNVIRHGKRIQYAPEAVANENATEAASTEFRRRIRLSAGAAQLLLRGITPTIAQPLALLYFVSHKFLRWTSPFIIIIGLAASIVLAKDELIYRLVIAVGAAFVVLAILGCVSLRLRRIALFAVPFFFTLGQIAIAYGICKGIFTPNDPRWPRTERPSTFDGRNKGESLG